MVQNQAGIDGSNSADQCQQNNDEDKKTQTTTPNSRYQSDVITAPADQQDDQDNQNERDGVHGMSPSVDDAI
jgi:hypothetical protein